MKTKHDFIIIANADPTEFGNDVTKRLQDGFKLRGQMVVMPETAQMKFTLLQAMTRTTMTLESGETLQPFTP